MNSQIVDPHNSCLLLTFILIIRAQSLFGLNNDGVILMSFKFSIIKDPFGVLQSWNYNDQSPCSWNGVTCGAMGLGQAYMVTGLSLPNSGLSGTIPATLGMIQFLTVLNLSNNSINGSIPMSLFGASQLQILDLSNNLISGGLPELVGQLGSLQVLNLSDNSLAGKLPENLTVLRNLNGVYLKNNYFSGLIPGRFNFVRVMDLSSNLINGSLPPDFGGWSLSYLNASFNKLTGHIPPEFGAGIPNTAVLDLSFNNLTGQIPGSDLFTHQDQDSFSGNPDLCGRPLPMPCPSPTLPGAPPTNVSPLGSPPAIAAIPTTIDSNPAAGSMSKRKLSTGAVLGIVIGDIAGISILAVVFVYVYRSRKRKKHAGESTIKQEAESTKEFDWESSSESAPEEYNWLRTWTCLKHPRHGAAAAEDDDETTTSEYMNSDGETKNLRTNQGMQTNGALVTLAGESELDLETLLKASAYILGASGSSIMYKTVLENGSVLAVRRIGENGVERFREFQNQIRVIAKLVHPNLVRILGFYWGSDEKLIIYDFVPNGSLATLRHRKPGTSSSSLHLPLETRLKIAKGVARGLSYIHEKKHVHANLKPSNILLGLDMEPKIGDFGLERLVYLGHSSKTVTGSGWNFGSKRSNTSRETIYDFTNGPTPSPSPSEIGLSPYHAPEFLRSLKPSPKWDVFSYGVVLLELLTGKVISSDETGLLVGSSTCTTDEEKGKVSRMADVAIRAEIEGKEAAFLGLMKLGFGCISPVPQKRPSMKEVLHALERFPSSSGSSSSYFHRV